MANEAMKNLLADKAFVEKMLIQETAEDVQKLFMENGVDLSMEEIDAIGRELNRLSQPDAEIDEADLDNVSGGLAVEIIGLIVAIGTFAQGMRAWYNSR